MVYVRNLSRLLVLGRCGSLNNVLRCICVVSGTSRKSAAYLGTKSKDCYQQQLSLSAFVSSYEAQGNATEDVFLYNRYTYQAQMGEHYVQQSVRLLWMLKQAPLMLITFL